MLRNQAAEDRHGGSNEGVVGKPAHKILRTVSPGPAKKIKEKLEQEGR